MSFLGPPGSFLVRSSSRRWSQNGGLAGLKSFVSSRRRGDSQAGSGAASPEDGLNSTGYLLAEVRDARAAVTVLDRCLFKVKSFKDASFELVEQAHLAMSRLEQAVAVRAAPELILLACEIKVAARRGAHLLRAYGEYNFLGKMVAWTRRRRVEAKYAAVTERLRGLMPGASPTPGDATPVSVSGAPMAAPHAGGLREGGHGLLERAVTAATEASGAAPAACGQVLRRGRHERVYCLSFAPQSVAAASGGMCVWWALEAAVEFYSDATGSTTSFGIEGDVFLTHVAVDTSGNTWGGTSCGTLLVRRPHVWDSQVEERLFGSAVRAIAFDADTSTVWAGDEHGCLRAARLRDEGWRIEPLLTALAGCAPRRGISVGALLSARNGSQGLRRVISNKQSDSTPHALEGPIRCLLVRDDRVWAAGGRSEPWVALFHASTGHQLCIWRCGSHGGCNAMLALSWQSPSSRSTGGSGTLATLGPGRSCSSGEGSALPSAAPLPVPEDIVCGDLRSTWQLLTGHDNGQVLVWNAAADVLQPVCKLGDVGSAVRGMASLDAWGLLATAHANGELALLARPGAASDWGGGAVGAAPSLGLSSPGGGSAHSSSGAGVPAAPIAPIHATAVGVPCIRPRRLVLRAHRTAIAAAAGCPSGLVTASNTGTLRLWRAPDLAREADRAGLLLGIARRPTASATSGSNADSGRLPLSSRQTTASVEVPVRPASASGVSAGSGPTSGAATSAAAAPSATPFGASATAFAAPGVAAALAGSLPGDRTASGQLPQVVHGGVASAAQAGVRSGVSRSEPLPQFGVDGGRADGDYAAVAAPGVALPPVDPPPGADDGEGAAWRPAGLGQLRVAAPSPTLGGQLSAQSSPFAGGVASPLRPAMPPPSPGGSPTGGGGTPGGGAGAVARYGSGPALAPRKPRAQRQVDALQQAESRERRKSERRLSKGAQLAWSTCQIIEGRELKLLSSIGSGAYGRVWLAEWMGTRVAAKELLCLTDRAKDDVSRKRRERRADADGVGDAASDSGSDSSEDSVEAEVAAELKELMNEVFMLGSLSHPNIMRFCAVCLDPPMIVTQYYQHGSLFQLLKKARRGEKRAQAELSWSKRLDMLRDVASGMVFLHSRRPPVVHGDLRSPNLLLDMAFDRDKPRLHVKIADFGLACMMGPAKTLAVSKVTNPRWSAPEVIRDSSVSTSADVFSYGVVMWELLTWEQPYEDMMSVQVLFSVMQNLRPEVPEDAELPGRPGPSLQAYKALMEACWHEDAEQRPSFEGIVAALDDMRASDRAARGEAGGASRRTSYSGESAMSSPLASAANSVSAIVSGRSFAVEAAAWGGAGGRAGSGDAPTYLEDDAPGGAGGRPAAAGPEQRSSGGASGPGTPGPSGNGGAGGVYAPHAFASPFSEQSGELPSASSHGSPGPFGASEPSFAFFAGGAGGGALPGGVSSGSPFGSAAAQAAPEGGTSQLHYQQQQQQQQYATTEALRAPSRTPSRLGRSSASGSGAAGGAMAGGLAATHSPRAVPPPSPSPFAAVQEAAETEPLQPDASTQPRSAQPWSPFAAASGAAVPDDLDEPEAGQRQGEQLEAGLQPQAVATQPWSPFAAVAAEPEACDNDFAGGNNRGHQQQQQQQQQGGSSPPSPTSPFAASSAQTGWPSAGAVIEKRTSPFAAVDLGAAASPRRPRRSEGPAVPAAQARAAGFEEAGGGQGLAVPDAPAEASFLFGVAPPPGLERLRQVQAQQAGSPAASNKSLTFPSPRR